MAAKPIAKIIGYADAEQTPEWFTTTPAKSSCQKQVYINDIDYWEVNEAFSVVGIENTHRLNLDSAKVNVNGSAVSMGHPPSASEARIIVTLINIPETTQCTIYGAAGIYNGGEWCQRNGY